MKGNEKPTPRSKARQRELPAYPSGSDELPVEVVIMAGGRGERMRPLTDDLPKPLLPIGGKPILHYLLRTLRKAGVRHVTFCLNYRGEMVKQAFGDGRKEGLEIRYISEDQPLGTIGGTRLKTEFRYDDVLVINGDLLTKLRPEDFYLFYLQKEADIAVASIPYRVNVPYGVFSINDQYGVEGTQEKPTFTYYINSGMYLMNRKALELVPEGQAFDAIDLVEKARQAGLKIFSYPLLDYWIDIGKMEDYEKAQKDIRFLQF